MTIRIFSCIVDYVVEMQQKLHNKRCAGMAELADAQASGACGSNIVRVQVPLPALFFCLRTDLQKRSLHSHFFCKYSDLFFHLLL